MSPAAPDGLSVVRAVSRGLAGADTEDRVLCAPATSTTY